ncbi:MAG: AAA family ATPase [Lachnospiraceae bacterium]|nr:AAA family ATPase [Lachnospiraceae bacterium]
MKLISCHIENFGKISDRTIDFCDGVNAFCESNGWGKTTLASFILTMFYGFSGDGKRDDFENERKRFKPWQGGVYGGQLTFEKNGRHYIISRVFGSKSGDDKMELRDADTNLPVQLNYAQPGEEFFGIDRKSFCRTAFITQNDCVTTTTDSINAKLGNLAENTDDINNFEKVAGKLNDLLNSMSPRRATGSLYKMKAEMTGLEIELRQGEGINESISQLEARIQEKKEQADNLKEEQLKLQKNRTDFTSFAELKGKREKHELLLQRVNSVKEKLAGIRMAFPREIPELKELDSVITECELIHNVSRDMKLYVPDEDDEYTFRELGIYFADGIPTEEVIEDYREKVGRLKSYRHELNECKPDKGELAKLEEYSQKFRENVPEERDFREIQEALHNKEERKSGLNAKMSRYDAMSSLPEQKPDTGNSVMFIVLGVILLVAGAAGFTINAAVGIAGVVLGVALLLTGIIMNRKAKRRFEEKCQAEEDSMRLLLSGIDEDKAYIENVDRKTAEFLHQYGLEYNQYDVNEKLYELRKESEEYIRLLVKSKNENIARYENEINVLENEVRDFGAKYGEVIDADFSNCDNALYNISRKATEFSRLKKNKSEYKSLNEQYNYSKQKVEKYCEKIGVIPEHDRPVAQMMEIRGMYEKHEECLQEYEAEKEKLETFEAETDVERLYSISVPDESVTLEEIDKRINDITDEIDEINGIIRDYRRQVEVYAEKKDALTEKESVFENLKESFAEKKKKYELIKLTKEYLEKSKTSFTAKYMEPIMRGYRKYYGMISGKNADKYYIDADTNLTVEEQGLQRETKFLSTGYKDLIGICMRMALVEAMYEDEKPFVVFDDPFVNLDEEKTEKGKEFLREIAKDYQVIYFTCHSDRA